MADEADGDDESGTERVSLSLPKQTINQLLENGPDGLDIQDGIRRAVWTQVELDEADEVTVVKNRK